MSCRNPHDIPCRQVPGGVFPYHDGGPGQARYEKIRPPGNDAALKAARRGPRFASRLNAGGRQAISPSTAAGPPARSSHTTVGSGNPAREGLPPGPSGENLAAAPARRRGLDR